MPSAILLGGNGQIGRAASASLSADGWDVVAVSRSGDLPDELRALGVRSAQADCSDDGELRSVLGGGADVVIDIRAYTREDAERLIRLRHLVGSAIAISSASVYADSEGRSLDEASGVDAFPRFPTPIYETQPTVKPGEGTYSTRKVEMERTLLESSLPTTVLRPCAIYGPGSSAPRELFFVKRIADRRDAAVLVSNGESRFQTTSVGNLAELIRLAASTPGTRVLNCGDPTSPTTIEIGDAIRSSLGAQLSLVPINESGFERPDLANPWAVPGPVILDMTAAECQLGYEPVSTYSESVGATCEWIVGELRHRDWSNTYLKDYFDYAAEDARLRDLSVDSNG